MFLILTVTLASESETTYITFHLCGWYQLNVSYDCWSTFLSIFEYSMKWRSNIRLDRGTCMVTYKNPFMQCLSCNLGDELITDTNTFTPGTVLSSNVMGLLPDTQYCGLRVRRECGEPFPRYCELAIPNASRHVHDARAVMHAGIAN